MDMVILKSLTLTQPLQIGPKYRSCKGYLLFHLLACLVVLLLLPLAIVFVKLKTLLIQRTLLSLRATCAGSCICFWNCLEKNSWTPWRGILSRKNINCQHHVQVQSGFTKSNHPNSSATLENAIYVVGTWNRGLIWCPIWLWTNPSESILDPKNCWLDDPAACVWQHFSEVPQEEYGWNLPRY